MSLGPPAQRLGFIALNDCALLVIAQEKGLHSAAWVLDEATASIRMAPDLFPDGRAFDSKQALRYAAGFEIGRLGPDTPSTSARFAQELCGSAGRGASNLHRSGRPHELAATFRNPCCSAPNTMCS